MENNQINFELKESNKLSPRLRVLYVIVGLFYIVWQVKTIYSGNQIINYFNYVLLLFGVAFVVLGALGVHFRPGKRSILITDDKIEIRYPIKKHLVIPANQVISIFLRPTKMKITTKEGEINFGVTWIAYQQLQQLKDVVSLFCKQNNIEEKEI